MLLEGTLFRLVSRKTKGTTKGKVTHFGGSHGSAILRRPVARGFLSVLRGDHAESIALYNSEATEESRLNGRFEWIVRVLGALGLALSRQF